ncbi:SH3 domain-containing YSC84-like protein 1 [Cytospora mali]|uniref:SH3 domain-containing YSC84-like protein 1 n=1 Tax=Cytospora mali TaxID=578113 RepID=A0A194V602_CYTMA|nr:SH3 domain-containing YSC84-like protein 1 [Valsa mali var. pyri (nom. inval.)]
MTDKTKSDEGFYPPPPPGPPPGHNGLAMHPTDQPVPDSQSELYDHPPSPTQPLPQEKQQQQQQQQQQEQQQTPHRPPPANTNGAPPKAGWSQRLSVWGGKAATPLNALANKLGAESFMPGTMDKECEKAARILRSFCKDGIYTDAQAPETVEATTTDEYGMPITTAAKPKKNRTLLSIPSKVINRAVGLAIFTTARAGFHLSGATGSGILVARLPDGSWSPPSGIQVHSVGAGFMFGIDIYDCVVVINTREALDAFTKTRMSLGSDLAVVAGPWGAGGAVDFTAPPPEKGKGKERAASQSPSRDFESRRPTVKSDAASDKFSYDLSRVSTGSEPHGMPERPQAGKERKTSVLRQAIKKPTYSYVKSRGFYAGVQVDGTMITERKDANAAFYGEAVSVQSILRGEIPMIPGKDNWLNTIRPLFDVIKGAEGWRGQQTGQWANQQGPAPGSPHFYNHGNASQGYPTGFDPVSSFPTGTSEHAPSKPPRPAAGASSVGGVTEGVRGINLDGSTTGSSPVPHAEDKTPGARAKAAEAAAESEAARAQEEQERRDVEAKMARERAASSQPRPVSMAPPYTEVAAPWESSHGAAIDEEPPAYVDDGAAAPEHGSGHWPGDTKHPDGPSS